MGSGAIVEATKALVGVGRALETRGLHCDAAGVDLDSRGGILVDEDLRTSQPHIYAAGDITGRMLLAQADSSMGEFAGRGAAGASFPWATSTTPEVAGVGMTVEKAERSGKACASASVRLTDNVMVRIDRSTEGFFKVVGERETGERDARYFIRAYEYLRVDIRSVFVNDIII